MRTVNARILKEEKPRKAKPLSKARYAEPEAEISCFYRPDDRNGIRIMRDGIGEKNRFVQAVSHFK